MGAEDRRLNVGCGAFPLDGWANLDMSATCPADITADAIEYLHGSEVGRYDEIYAGHFLEHLTYQEAEAFMAECWRVLVPGGRLGVLVPDTREIMRRYLAGAIDVVECPQNRWWPVADLNSVCALFIYSIIQDSPHQWMYDERTLRRAFENAGFIGMREIDRYRDPRLGSPQWYQFGLDGWKPKGAQ
jgi:predicted SAM-dependent methyltransferase